MPRPAQGPKLRLFGPDDRYGARRRDGFKEYRWYIMYRENGRPRERTTGLDHRAGTEALERALADFVARQERGRRPAGPRRPEEIAVTEILALYGEQHAPHTRDPARIGHAIAALVRWWGDSLLSAVTKAACQRYARERKVEIAAARAERRRQVEARSLTLGKAPPPVIAGARTASDGTARRELGTLAAAVAWCRGEGLLTEAVPVVLPDKPEPRERWLTRSEAARLLRAARKLKRSKGYLPLFILLGLYCGARKEALLTLQWQPNAQGGWVDLERGVIDFRKAGQAQTNKRRATVPIPPRLLPFLKAARRRTRKYVLEYRPPTDRERAAGVISVPVTDPKKAFATAAIAAGLGNVHPHTLRHTAVTWLVQAGVPLWTVSGWVGMSEDMIRRVYGHHDPKRFEKVLEVLS